MSLKNDISPTAIAEAIMALPQNTAHHCKSDSPAQKIRASIKARGPRAINNRVVIYRYDGDGQGRELCDRVQGALQSGNLPFHALCEKLNADLQLIELGQGKPTPDDNARAAAFGMMAAEEDTGLLIVSAFGAEPAVRLANPDFFTAASPDTAAMLGAIVSAARAGVPVIAEGLKGLEAARALYAVRPDLCENVFICGVPANLVDLDTHLTIFADAKPDHPAYAGVALATLFLTESDRDQAA